LPSRPLTERELQSLDDATAYCRDPDTGEAYIIVYISENSVSALGYEDRETAGFNFTREIPSFPRKRLRTSTTKSRGGRRLGTAGKLTPVTYG